MFNNGVKKEPINLVREVNKYNQKYANPGQAGYFKKEMKGGPRSSFFDPYSTTFNQYGTLRTIDRYYNRTISCQTLRRVSSKAWLVNLCITHVQKKIKPFLKPSTDRNVRGYVIHKHGENVGKAAGKSNSARKKIEEFIKHTGFDATDDRDTFVKYTLKIVRDLLELDQVSTEIITNRAGQPTAFCAVDAATIEKVAPDQDNPLNIKYVQLIDGIPQAFYPEGNLIFDYMNPRTDIYYSYYGYSYVEQAIDLVTSEINTLAYNQGFFTENKLPKGMLLLNGNVSQENVELMEDYIGDLMSGNPSSQWRIPIIPSGTDQGEIKWVQLGGNNREMEFQQWLDFLNSGIVSMFGCSMEELGLHSTKSQPVFENNKAPEIEASKSLVLGDMLSFLQDYFNRIIEIFFPEYELEFVGYERDDPKLMLDLSKGEMESYKTVNEVREDNGLKPLESDWADEVPANPQLMQAYQSAKAQEMGGGLDEEGGDFGDYEGEEGEETEEVAAEEPQEEEGGETEEQPEEETKVDNNAWDDVAGSVEKSIKIIL